MKKKVTKQIRAIAEKLPKVYEAHVSGGVFGVDEEKGQVFEPNVYHVEINHERRLRKAYEQLGMDGIRNYLDQIHKLQLDRNEKAFGSNGDRESGVLPDVPADLEDQDPADVQN
jgi:hypothetical protein